MWCIRGTAGKLARPKLDTIDQYRRHGNHPQSTDLEGQRCCAGTTGFKWYGLVPAELGAEHQFADECGRRVGAFAAEFELRKDLLARRPAQSGRITPQTRSLGPATGVYRLVGAGARLFRFIKTTLDTLLPGITQPGRLYTS
jgi:hypothetical protein